MLLKMFRRKRHEIEPMAPGYGGCIATDRITVDGSPVGYMYREESIREEDSGWRFFAGDEDEAYMNDLQRHSVYDVNTIVNCDPYILPYLDARPGSRFERNPDGRFRLLLKDE